MTSHLSAALIVGVQFGNLETFCEELAARGPNVEPVVRICQQVRRGHSEDHGPLPLEHVFGHVSYLRRSGDVLQILALHLYVGQRWMPAEATPDAAELQARINAVYDRVREHCHRLGYVLVDGSTYQDPRDVAQGG